jgi:transglutaminase-like putative cysteine protease
MNRLPWTVAALLAAPLAFAAPATQLELVSNYTVNADLTHAEEQLSRVRIDEPSAVRALGQVSLRYSTSLQTVEILEAHTTTKDGQRLDVAPDKIFEQQLPQSSGAPMFYDHKVKVVVFPQVEVGSVITLRYRRTQLQPNFPGLFTLWELPSASMDVERMSVTLTAPASVELHIDTRDAQGGEVASPVAGLRKWEWNFAPSKGRVPEMRQVSPRDVAPYVMVSTAANYDQIGKTYADGAGPRSKATPAVRKLADEITKGIKDRRTQAAALYEWVSKNIRYVAIHLEQGGYIPHTADEILAARYGDCKDHVTLLEALLDAKKIRSSPVLIQAGDSYFIPKSAQPAAFNHAITWLPEFDLFADSTPGSMPFGSLTPTEVGKQVLVIDTGKGKSEFRTLPVPSPEQDWATARSEFTVTDDGTLDGKTVVESGGIYQAADRAMFTNTPADRLPQLADRLVAGRGKGSFEVGDPRDFSKPLSYAFAVTYPANVQLPGPGAMAVPSGGRVGNSISAFASGGAAQERTTPFNCPSPGKHTEVTRTKLPGGMKVTAIPKPVKLTAPFGAYEASYEQAGDTIVATRTLALDYRKPTCTPEEYTALRSFAQAVGQDLRGQIVYQ